MRAWRMASSFATSAPRSAVRFLTHLIRHYRTLGIKIAGVFTHNGAAYRSKGFRRACDRMGLRAQLSE
jgi:transposase InsO family protein